MVCLWVLVKSRLFRVILCPIGLATGGYIDPTLAGRCPAPHLARSAPSARRLRPGSTKGLSPLQPHGGFLKNGVKGSTDPSRRRRAARGTESLAHEGLSFDDLIFSLLADKIHLVFAERRPAAKVLAKLADKNG